jgi:hypothetical protein
MNRVLVFWGLEGEGARGEDKHQGSTAPGAAAAAAFSPLRACSNRPDTRGGAAAGFVDRGDCERGRVRLALWSLASAR